jgi:hypothetical protein
MADITRASASPFIPQIWANTALEILRAKIVLAKLVTRDSDLAAFAVGDTLNIPYPGAFTSNDKAANTPVTLQVPTATTAQVVLNKHKEASFLIEDAVRATANQDVMARYMEAAVIPLAEQIESDLMALGSTFTNSVGTYGTDITAATVRSARKVLNDNKAPVDGRVLIVSDKDEIALLGDSTLQNYFAFAQQSGVAEGSIGRLYGFDVYSSQLVPATGSGPVNTKNIAFHPGALILAMRGLPEAVPGSGAQTAVVNDPVSGLALRVTIAYNAANLGHQVTVDVLYGVAKLRDEKGVLVKA